MDYGQIHVYKLLASLFFDYLCAENGQRNLLCITQTNLTLGFLLCNTSMLACLMQHPFPGGCLDFSHIGTCWYRLFSHDVTAERSVMLVTKVIYFGKFGYLSSSCIRKCIILMFLSSSREKFTLLQQNLVTKVSVGFRRLCWCRSRWAPAWRLRTNLY